VAIPSWLTLADRVAIVTGCGSPSGIGIATARALAELGAIVVITATTDHIQDRVTELRSQGLSITGTHVDLATSVGAGSLLNFTLNEAGAPSILVNNAGMTSSGSVVESGSATDISEDEWHGGLRRNLDTAFHISRAVIPHMRQQHFGRIVFVTSVTGPFMAMRSEAAYAAAKAGMVGLMRSIAIDEAEHGITSNAVAPGWIDTGAQTTSERAEGRHVPLGRSGTPGEVATTIASLCLPGASYTTGQVVVVDGGNSVSEERLPGN
jgi:3-oxoacyl-[acyl-carrier protein] reductase